MTTPDHQGALDALDRMLAKASNDDELVDIILVRRALVSAPPAPARLTFKEDDPVNHAAMTDLPPLTGSKTTSKHVGCPTCRAKPGQGCFKMDRKGPGGKPTTEPRGAYHRARAAKAKEMNVVRWDAS